jgi:hypothetical protein
MNCDFWIARRINNTRGNVAASPKLSLLNIFHELSYLE